jgi:hypothetical protein
MAAILDDLKGVPVGRLGGQIDYQGSIRVINEGSGTVTPIINVIAIHD